uniref:Uncharacterized protein n=1 Tax=Dunaliella tertiolecta TaxID=3047 RepID=A0A7S3QZ93_DUNTE
MSLQMAGCKQECEKHWASVLIFILTAWILVEARKKSYTQIWWLVLTSAMLKNATLLHMSYFGVTKVPFTVLYMDLPTHLMTTVPHELMLNLRGVPLSLLFLCNAGANAVFHHSVANQSILVSTLRAISVQAVCVCAFVVARRSIIRSSFQACKAKGGSSWPEAKQLEQQQQASGVPQLHEPEAQRQLEEEQQEGLGLKHGKDAGASEHSSTVSQVQSRGDAEPSPAVAAAAAAAAAANQGASSVAGADGGLVGIRTAGGMVLRAESNVQARQQQQQQQQASDICEGRATSVLCCCASIPAAGHHSGVGPACIASGAGPHCADGRAGQRLYCWPCRHARPHPVGKHAAVCLGGAHQSPAAELTASAGQGGARAAGANARGLA